VKFYDLSKDPIHCPKCGAVYQVAPVVSSRPRPDAAAARPAAVEEVATPEPQEIETVSLEEADAEAQGGTKKPAIAEAALEDDVEVDEALDGDDDDTFIEEQEEEDADVTDIIGGDIENEEEG
jgi:uncharacterized protein (TIGR02300 family)